MTEISVRVPESAQWRCHRDVRLAALAKAPYAFGSTPARERAFTEDAWPGRPAARTTRVAERDGRPCGLVGVRPPEADGRAEPVSPWVRPGARGSGVADALVRRALTPAAADGAAQVCRWVVVADPRAGRLYERGGFRRTGEEQPVRAGGAAREFASARPVPVGAQRRWTVSPVRAEWRAASRTRSASTASRAVTGGASPARTAVATAA